MSKTIKAPVIESRTRYRTSGNFVFGLAIDTEKPNVEPSLTVPDLSLTMREIYTRFASGRSLPSIATQPVFYGDEEMPNLKRMDLTEIGQMLEQTRERISELQDQHTNDLKVLRLAEEEKREQRQKAEDERLLKLYEERQRSSK